ncbi:PREDICTED: uncharacterized protein LOC105569393, partial [Vollenhovia emeryi]|uniref:uncharacterized protein LOC105569393 n=1 Tax=Vollenhovia emeryi TaxID=411798 RepID=UPI0005F4B5F8
GGTDWGEAVATGNVAVACTIRAIKALGLRVAARKTEAVFFHDGSAGPPPEAQLGVDGENIKVGAHIKHLGLHIDGRWGFEEHVRRLAPRLDSAGNALSRLMPNLGGPSGKVRRLYANIITSMATYGAPVWAEALRRSRKSLTILRGTQRRMAIRAIRGYRTVSHTAATLMAGMPPLDLVAAEYAKVYRRTRELRGQGVPVTARARRLLGAQAKRETREDWRARLAKPNTPGKRTVEAILPCLDAWMERPWARAYFRTSQVLTGHGCFGEYLRQIGREGSGRCHHCGADKDSAQHTLEECPEWDAQRRVLVVKIGPDLSPRAVVSAITEDRGKWEAFSSFCEHVMLQKEEAERVRRGETIPTAPQGGGAGARRRVRRGIPAHLRKWNLA